MYCENKVYDGTKEITFSIIEPEREVWLFCSIASTEGWDPVKNKQQLFTVFGPKYNHIFVRPYFCIDTNRCPGSFVKKPNAKEVRVRGMVLTAW